MPFTSYRDIAEVAHRHRIQCQRAAFVNPVDFQLSSHFRSELDFTLSEIGFERSEYATSETLIYPLLREVWKPFHRALTLWSHEPITYDEDLSGVPDYFVARRSPLGAIIPDLPILLVAEAKRDDYVRGWGQCLAAMLAAQKLNEVSDQAFFGIATNGRAWEFGQLLGGVFIQDSRVFSLDDVDRLAAAVHFMMIRCREQLANQPATI
jgi:hypothetical protein